jgi:beta-xylosidase
VIFSEYNASYKNEPDVTDAPFMGPWLADTIRQCDGLTEIMSYWTFSDVFEEQGVVKEPFYGGFGADRRRRICRSPPSTLQASARSAISASRKSNPIPCS